MTTPKNDRYFGLPPMPTVELTMEQQFKMKQLEDMLPNADKEDIITVYLALQRQAFVLGNNIKQLLREWGKDQPTTKEEPLNLGTIFETKD